MEKNYTIKPFLKNNPVRDIADKDFENYVLKFGTILQLIYNKNINPTFLFLSIIKDENLQKIFKKMTGISDTKEILMNILTIYPNLLKSKIVKEHCIKYIKKLKKEKEAKDVNKRSKKNI